MAEQLRYNSSLFIDSSDLGEIEKWDRTGIIEGVTTNQNILYENGVGREEVIPTIKAICARMGDRPVSVELSSSQASEETMLEEAKRWSNLAKNIVVKVPMVPWSTKTLEVAHRLTEEDIAVNVTAMMTFEQMQMAARAIKGSEKPSFLSLFWGRSIEDHVTYRSRSDFMSEFPRVGFDSEINSTPRNIVSHVLKFLQENHYDNLWIIAGSMRTAIMISEAFSAGSHIVTATPQILEATLFSQKTIDTNKQFDEAWEKVQSNGKRSSDLIHITHP